MSSKLLQTENLANSLLAKYVPEDTYGKWNFEFNSSRRRLGLCKYSKKTIYLSIYHLAAHSLPALEETIRHEIAHIHSGKLGDYGHGPTWKYIAKLLGARPKACAEISMAQVAAKYIAICAGCKKQFFRNKKVKQGHWKYCLKCGQELGYLHFRENL